MKRMLTAMIALAVLGNAIHADWGGSGPPSTGSAPAMNIAPAGGPNTLLGLGDPYNGVAPDKYGLNPRIKRFFKRGGGTGEPASKAQYYPLMGYNQGGPAYNPTGYPPGSYAPAQGTLVFPNHPFVRSPRDYFMYDVNR